MAAGSFNKVIIGGRLGRDPEIHAFDNGNRVARLSIATSEQWTTGNGVREEKTDWHAGVLFRQAAVDFAERNLRKGDLVMLEGQLENRSFEQDGVKRTVTEIVVREGRGDVTLMAKAPGQTTTAPPASGENGSGRPAARTRTSTARSAPVR